VRLVARTASGLFGIEIDTDVLSQIDRLCEASGDAETGGILVGRYSHDRSTAYVLEATPAPLDSRS